MEDIVVTDGSKCRRCYSCIRNCPVKAVRIEEGKAQIVQSKCIQCGNCIRACSGNAKIINDSKNRVTELMNTGKKAVLVLAPSFVVGFYPMSVGEIIEGFRNMGFSEVWETAIGAEYVLESVTEYVKNNPKKTLLSSACPSFVSMVEKHYPNLIENLIPICSPMIATGRLIRQIHKDVIVVFVGPCIAKKEEMRQGQFESCIDVVLTYNEAKEWMEAYPNKMNPLYADFKYYTADKGRKIPLTGTINEHIRQQMPEGDLLTVDGAAHCVELLKYLNGCHGKFTYEFCDTLMCRGCIDGPELYNRLSLFEKQRILERFIQGREIPPFSVCFDQEILIDMKRRFQDKSVKCKDPSPEDIQRILTSIGKLTAEDELNCGACGYDTCREKATAVYRHMAESEMCLPYLIEKKNQLYQVLSKRFKTIQKLKNEMKAIFDSSYDGLIMCDAKGKILKANSAYTKMVGIDELPETVMELEQRKIVFPSASLLALKERRRITFLQEIKGGKKLIATGNPIMDDKGVLLGVVTNIRDIDELNRLRNNIGYEKPEGQSRGYTGIVTNSREFGEIVNIAARAAGYKSTVLLLGETGVGKDVIARFIHYISELKDGPFIKINCGAIPENLIEAELFGYESGAFTGAKREGKKGLFELANNGTVFLDEIGDLPALMQVKLLAVLQDKVITRIGGGKTIPVDVRIIAATNKDLEQMTKTGSFRSDLYYRLHVVPIKIPPLRERKDDIMPLAYHFLELFNKKYNADKDFSPDIQEIFMEYYWPGNVRELENIIERLTVTTGHSVITKEDLPPYLFDSDGSPGHSIIVNRILPLNVAKEEVENIILKRAYKIYKNTYKVAEVLGVNQSTISRKIKKLKE